MRVCACSHFRFQIIVKIVPLTTEIVCQIHDNNKQNIYLQNFFIKQNSVPNNVYNLHRTIFNFVENDVLNFVKLQSLWTPVLAEFIVCQVIML